MITRSFNTNVLKDVELSEWIMICLNKGRSRPENNENGYGEYVKPIGMKDASSMFSFIAIPQFKKRIKYYF